MTQPRATPFTREQRENWASISSALRLTGHTSMADMLDEQILAAWDAAAETNRWAAFTDDELTSLVRWYDKAWHDEADPEDTPLVVEIVLERKRRKAGDGPNS